MMERHESNVPIGLYDSGVGGLTVLTKLIEKMPHEDFIYFADTKNVPYGGKSEDEIKNLSNDIIRWLYQNKNAKAIVAACHTSSAIALDEISKKYDIPIIGMIRPMEKIICKIEGCAGIIATEAASKSKMHEKIFKSMGSKAEFIYAPCPDFVPLIEAGDFDKIPLAAANYLRIFEEQKIDYLLYCCTHYPIIRHIIEPILPENVIHIDPAEHVAADLYNKLCEKDLLCTHGNGSISFFGSSDISHISDIFYAKIQQMKKAC